MTVPDDDADLPGPGLLGEAALHRIARSLAWAASANAKKAPMTGADADVRASRKASNRQAPAARFVIVPSIEGPRPVRRRNTRRIKPSRATRATIASIARWSRRNAVMAPDPSGGVRLYGGRPKGLVQLNDPPIEPPRKGDPSEIGRDEPRGNAGNSPKLDD